jgi:hypothetical protein
MPLRKDPEGDRFDNPNTTPGGPAKDSTATDEPQPKDDGATEDESDVNDRVNSLIRSRLQEIVKVEADTLISLCAKPSQFLARVEKLYGDSQFSSMLKRVVCELGGSLEQSTEYAAESQRLIIDISGNVTESGLEQAVREEVSTWVERAERLAAILSQRKEAVV